MSLAINLGLRLHPHDQGFSRFIESGLPVNGAKHPKVWDPNLGGMKPKLGFIFSIIQVSF